MENIITEYGTKWQCSNIKNIGETIFNSTAYKLHHEVLGNVIFADDTDKYNFIKEQDYYKIRSIIYEQKIRNKIVFICEDKKYGEWMDQLGSYAKNYYILEKSKVLDDFPKTIEEKKKRIIMNLYNIQSDYGKIIEMNVPELFFAKDKFDTDFFAKSMIEGKLLNCTGAPKWYDEENMYKRPMWGIIIGDEGWKIIEKEQNKISRQAFVAMSFSKELEKVGDMIMKAITDSTFDAIRIDKEEYNSDITGQILWDIKHSHFVVADVTEQKNGVYFEGGYAIGNNIPVIWCCRKDEIQEVHFDTNHYNHILWETPEELYIKLKDRIKGTILLEDE